MFNIDIRNSKSLYEQLVDNIEKLIYKKVLLPDTKLPSVRSLAIELSINPNTIQKAYSKLEDMGFIYSVKGKGSFVSSNCEDIINKRLLDIKFQVKELINEAVDMGASFEEINSWFKWED